MGNWPTSKTISFHLQLVFSANQFHNMRSYYESEHKYTNNIESKTGVRHSDGKQRECRFTHTAAGGLPGVLFLGRFLKMGKMTLLVNTTVAILGTGTRKQASGCDHANRRL